MRQLFPHATAAVDLVEAYRLPATDVRHVRVNMVSSVDGAAAVAGRVGTLTNPTDQALLHLLRSLADVVLVGAGTVRAEGYGPVRMTGEQGARREANGQAPAPPLAIVTRSLDLDVGASLFTKAVARPLVITTASAPRERRDAVAELADVVLAGDDAVDLTVAVDALVGRGMTRILSEGGPHLLGELFAGDLVDELCLAVAPVVTLGHETRIASGPGLAVPAALRLGHVLEEDGFLFLRYARPGVGGRTDVSS